MHPALSIIAFTVSTGLGYGWVALSILLDLSGIAPFVSDSHRLWSGIVALILITAGLLSSVAHLANPRNAWRAVFRVRTSWLSREGVMALLFYPPFLAYLVFAGRAEAVPTVLALLCALMALGTVLCTAMIYACLRTIRQWRTPLTPLNFLAISLSLGGLAHLFSRALSTETTLGAGSTVVLLLLLAAFAGKLAYFLSMGLPDSTSISIATGFRMATVRLLDVGHTAGTFLTDEFGYEVSRSLLVSLRVLVLVAGFVIPAIIVARNAQPLGLAFAFLLALAGALVERWLFFAEAQHVVRLYHGQTAT